MFISIAVKLAVGLAGLVIVMRLLGKKALSDVTPYDIIYSLILGGIIEESLYDDSIHIGHIVFALAVWGVLIYLLEASLQRSDKTTRRLKGKPAVLIYNGRLNIEELQKNHIEMEQLRTFMRQQGCFSLKQVKQAVLEPSGQVNMILDEDVPTGFSFLVIDEGKVEAEVLRSLKKDQSWLTAQLEQQSVAKIEDVIYAEWSEENGFYCLTYDDCLYQSIVLDG